MNQIIIGLPEELAPVAFVFRHVIETSSSIGMLIFEAAAPLKKSYNSIMTKKRASCRREGIIFPPMPFPCGLWEQALAQGYLAAG